VDGKTHLALLPRAKWQVVVREAHVGSISWVAYDMHLTHVAAKSQACTPQRLRPPARGQPSYKGWCGEAAVGSG
jgi:hypothetical protein